MGSFILFVFTLVVAAVLSVWEGFVLTKLWGWFLVPHFGMAALPITIAIGISLIAAFLTHQSKPKSNESLEDQIVELFGRSITNGLVMLLMGWTVTQFM